MNITEIAWKPAVRALELFGRVLAVLKKASEGAGKRPNNRVCISSERDFGLFS